MTFPAFYDPQRVGSVYAPHVKDAVAAGRALGAPAASEDSKRVALLLIDMQIDFVHSDGALSVPGAIDDTRRAIEWLFNHLTDVTTIYASLDSHYPIQVFHPAWWVDANGQHPEPYTVITSEQVQAGRWRALYEPEWSSVYVEKLEEASKKQLMIWPYHALIGTHGHTLTPALYEAVAYHTGARQAQPVLIEKGKIAKSENYSAFEPEVKLDELPNGGLQVDRLEELAGYDRIYITGQAKSHCVLESVATLMRYFAQRPDVIGKLRVLVDTMSSVAHPAIDFEAIANDTFQRFTQQGLTLVKAADGID